MESYSPAPFKPQCLRHDATAQQNPHALFLALVPQIRRLANYHLRRLLAEAREDALQEIVAASFITYMRLAKRGKSDQAFAGALAKFGALQYLSGRRVGGRLNGQDVLSEYGRRKTGMSVERLDRFDKRLGTWQDLAVENRHTTPAVVAMTRLDFRAWLESLPERTRAVAEILATGEATSSVATMFGISSSRVSQLRAELRLAWLTFTGETVRGS
jgi:hypothetical protein